MSASRRVLAVLLGAAAFGYALPSTAQGVSSESRVATVVIAKVPPGVPRGKVVEGIVASVPTYRNIPGLIRKVFTVNDDAYGGMYLWTDRAAAQAWFTPDFIAKVKARTGVEPQIIYFDSPVQIDNRPLTN